MVTIEEIQATGLSLEDTEAIALALSAGRMRIQPTPIGIGTVLAAMAPVGGDFLNALEQIGQSDANVKWALKMIEQATFDVGHPVTRAQLEAFKQSAPALSAGIDALLNVALVPDPISDLDVRRALRDEQGNWLGG